MSCPTTIAPAPIPGIGDTRVVTLHGLADAAAIIREHAEMARQLSELQTDSVWKTADEMRERAAREVTSAVTLLVGRDDVLADAVQSSRLQAEIFALRRERDELAAWRAKIESQHPVAWVPMHPRCGALWAMTTAAPSEERLPSHYPLSPLYASPAPAAAPVSCQHQQPVKPCRTCGPDGCPDRVSCPRGER